MVLVLAELGKLELFVVKLDHIYLISHTCVLSVSINMNLDLLTINNALMLILDKPRVFIKQIHIFISNMTQKYII